LIFTSVEAVGNMHGNQWKRRSGPSVMMTAIAISARALSVIGMESSPKDSNAICQVDWNLNR
jgi:hypothetical protein